MLDYDQDGIVKPSDFEAFYKDTDRIQKLYELDERDAIVDLSVRRHSNFKTKQNSKDPTIIRRGWSTIDVHTLICKRAILCVMLPPNPRPDIYEDNEQDEQDMEEEEKDDDDDDNDDDDNDVHDI